MKSFTSKIKNLLVLGNKKFCQLNTRSYYNPYPEVNNNNIFPYNEQNIIDKFNILNIKEIIEIEDLNDEMIKEIEFKGRNSKTPSRVNIVYITFSLIMVLGRVPLL
jgi:hypothetical protein